MNLIFLNSATLAKRELLKAFKKVNGLTLINLEIEPRPSRKSIELYIEKLKPYLPGIVFSINNAGYDTDGILFKKLEKVGSLFINWYHDDPFYDSIYFKRFIEHSPKRIDFVSEPTFEDALKSKGYKNIFYLPLATDPDYFNTKENTDIERDIAFVGNSTLELMDFVIDDSVYKKIETNSSIIKDLSNRYNKDLSFDIDMVIKKEYTEYLDTCNSEEEVYKLIFATKWFISYQSRKNFLVDISNNYADSLTIFGDPYWKNFISNSPVSTDACYYDNLCHLYRASKINLNLNRIQIRTAFTQRHFDTKASGSFLLTEKRPMNRSVFITEGENREIVEFENIAECKKLIDYYLENDEERKAIGLAGREKILKHHTYDNRVEEILGIAQNIWK